MTAPVRWVSCERAWVGDRILTDILLGIDDDGTFTHVVDRQGGRDESADRPDPGAVEHVAGVVLPGLVSAHGHSFHRLLRGRAQPAVAGASTAAPTTSSANFWGWREAMYAATTELDPDTLFTVARAAYGEMARAGITLVGEFHYLHHGPAGQPHDDPNAMGQALVAAAEEVGVRLTLLDALYLTGQVGATLDEPSLDPVQRRFSDGDAGRWADRVGALRETATARVGVAIHSVRAVPPPEMAVAADLVRSGGARVLHAHVAEQRDEVEATRAVHGRTPVQLFADAGALSDLFTAVHGVWLADEDIALLSQASATVCVCPTTERDLADGVVDGRRLADADVRLALGCDQHAVVDLFEEARALEVDQRLVTGTRGHHHPTELLAAATRGGADSLGWPEAGRLAVGAPADLLVVDTDSVRLAGSDDVLPTALVYAASATDVVATMVGGRWIVRDRQHVRRNVEADLREAMAIGVANDTQRSVTTP